MKTIRKSTSTGLHLMIALAASGAFLTTDLAALDWPQWRGPNRNGISQETGLLKEWPKEGPKLLWQVKAIGLGYSTPAVLGDSLYLLSNEALDHEFVLALSVKDGQKLWSTPLGPVGLPDQQPNYPAARSTPTVDADSLYALSSDGNLACLETATGKIRWQKNIRTEFGGQPGKWAYAESPLIDGDAVICSPGGSDATLVALNKKTGEPIWKSAVPGGDPAAYASVITLELGGIKQYVQFLEKGLVGVEAKTGKFLWRYDKTAQGSPANIPTPIAHEDLIYSAGGRSGGGLVKLKADSGNITAEQVYFSPKLPTSIGGAVRVGDYLYGTTGQALLCTEFATGTVKWSDRCLGPAALCYAEGNLYLHGENGDVALVAANPEAYQEKGRFTPPDQPDRGKSKAWAYPVVANGRLYVRDLASLWCYDARQASAK
jgi:outer membrane protein assembly factor BamB